MLVYANYIPVRSPDGLLNPLGPVATWLSRRMRRRGSPADLLNGLEARNAHGWFIRSVSTSESYPHLASVELVHPDREVAGRQWRTEIGLQQRAPGADVEISVLVHTNEVSARVTAPVTPAAPTFVKELLSECVLSSAAIGGDSLSLDDSDAEAFRHVLLDPARKHSYVVVSPHSDGTYSVDLAWLQKMLIGIAELVVIPPSADTFWLARGVGEEYVPYRGAVKLVHPMRDGGRVDVRTFKADELRSAGQSHVTAAQELFSWVLHRTNLPLSWKHVSPTRVREEQLRRSLESKRAEAAASGDVAAYTRFLEEYVKEQEQATHTATEARKDAERKYDDLVSASEQTRRDLENKVEALKYRLDQLSASQDDSPYRSDEDTKAVASAVAEAVGGSLTPEQCLLLIEHLYPERVTVLPEAWTSARDSSSFNKCSKLFSLLHLLSTDYWSSLSSGEPDQEARKVFGTAYAPKESEGVSTNKEARRRRTFKYDGHDHVMERHLKIGFKPSAAETIRVHFEWFADRNRIVIGHCGPHINFS